MIVGQAKDRLHLLLFTRYLFVFIYLVISAMFVNNVCYLLICECLNIYMDIKWFLKTEGYLQHI